MQPFEPKISIRRSVSEPIFRGTAPEKQQPGSGCVCFLRCQSSSPEQTWPLTKTADSFSGERWIFGNELIWVPEFPLTPATGVKSEGPQNNFILLSYRWGVNTAGKQVANKCVLCVIKHTHKFTAICLNYGNYQQLTPEFFKFQKIASRSCKFCVRTKEGILCLIKK